ncbi:MAG: acyltransferase [Solibacillus sp.]
MKKVYFFEGIRGVAAFVVVISHFIQVFYPGLFSLNPELAHNEFEKNIAQSPLNLLYNGNFAVCIFFVLSGFVLSYKYFVKKENGILVESAVKRYFRLALPVTVSVLFAYILLKFNLYYYGYSISITKSTMPDFYAMEASLLNALQEGLFGAFFLKEFSHNAVLWTMYYELLGSFIVFAFLALFGNVRNRVIPYILLVVMFWDSYFVAFILGMILCDLHVNLSEKAHLIVKNKIVVLVTFLVGIYLASFPYVDVQGTMYEFIIIEGLEVNYFIMAHIVGAFLILFALLYSKLLQKIFELRPFLYLGNVSFSLYLIHFIIINSVSCYIFLKLFEQGISYNVSFLMAFCISIVVTFVLAHYMTKYVDLNSVKLSKLVYDKLFKKID